MKKNLAAVFVAVSMSFSATVFAEAIPENDPIETTDCAVLGENVRLNLSSGVSGAYECDEARNAINVGTCHSSGSRGTSLKCAQIGVDQANNAPIYNNDQCTNATDTITLTEPSYRGFRASTTGGSVGAQSLSSNCSSTTVEELVPFL